MSIDNWLYSRGENHQGGPVTARELNQLAAAGELCPTDLVWKEGMEEWVPASRIKGLRFSPPTATQPTGGESGKRFDAESLQAKIRNVHEQAEKAAGTFWIFDLKFNQFVSASIIRVVWSIYIFFGISGLALGIIGSVFKYPIIEAAVGSVLATIGFVFLTLLLRVWLEALMVVFRISEHLREMNSKLGA